MIQLISVSLNLSCSKKRVTFTQVNSDIELVNSYLVESYNLDNKM